MTTTLPPLPVVCPLCATDQYTRAHLTARQQDAAATLALHGPSPQYRAATEAAVVAMGRCGRRLACKQRHSAEAQP